MSEFFARPWLLLTAPIIYWLLKEVLQPTKSSGWANFLPPELAQRLLTQQTAAVNQPLLFKAEWVLGLLTLLFCWALAGVGYVLKADQLPSEPQELVIIQYLSPPIRGDAAPQRLLAISQQALIPLLNTRQQGKTALIYYAGSAHLVSPMTKDTATLRQLLSLTHPSVMPLVGHAPEAAFRLAARLGQLAISNKQGRLDWLWLTDTLPNAAAVTQLLNLKPPQARLYLIGLDASLATIEKQQAALASQGITLLHPSQLADYTVQLNGTSASVNQGSYQKNQQGIRLFQELSHWPLLVAVLLLLWQYFDQPRFKFNTGLLALLFGLGLGLISVQQPLYAANRTDLNAHAEFSLGHYAAAAELFAQWQIENTTAPVKQQAAMHFNTGTAWLLAEEYTLALASFERAAALQQALTGLACNQLLATWQLAEIQLTPQKITKETLLKTCETAMATAAKSFESSDDLQDKTRQQKDDWQPQEKPSCVACEPLSATQEKQLQQLQEDPWRLLRMRFKSELRAQQP
ncbi:MAG TPA: hypothetical protein VJY63_06690 [Marinospirillum sp.]|uniref:hypothetical protein n=1 Tax=Marinospirillum sp. TaxID=2183934 RepID=UPI002B4A61D7|nr:hypothetical protein [Marinospirillum sp.]HKM15592.1 hypothetical protein [Marinospirillum sp.]